MRFYLEDIGKNGKFASRIIKLVLTLTINNMKKTLLLFAAALFAMAGRVCAEDGLTAVGANVIILPSSYWDSEIEWSAWTWVYNSGTGYGDMNTWNDNYNKICGEPADDDEGRRWYEYWFHMMPKNDDVNWDQFDDEGNPVQILWEEHTAPYSDGATYGGKPSYQWTGYSVMADIYVRRIFTTNELLSGPVYLACGHDDAPAEYYINGELVYERTGFEGEYFDEEGRRHTDNGWNNAEYILLTDEQKALIKVGGQENVIAFHVHQNWGGAFADCGLYTKKEGGLDMGYTTPWEGKVLFNNFGGYNWDLQSPSNNPHHPWSPLFEAQEGDVYTFTMPGASDVTDTDSETFEEIGHWQEQLHFKSPIRIEEGHNYRFKVWLGSDKPFSNVVVKLTDNDDDDIELAYLEDVEIPASDNQGEDYEGKEVELEFMGMEVSNFKIAFDFGGGEEGATVTIKNISLVDLDPEEEDLEEKELWVGTHYFNFIYMCKRNVKYMVWDINDEGDSYQREATEEEMEDADEVVTYEVVNAPEIQGRVETLAWTQTDFDDSMWDDQMMPVGNDGYMAEVQSIWPGGDNTNYWIRRNFELDKINERLSYELNVCHDDVYETYVNGHLLQKNVGWTNGKNPVQVHIPARYLNVGKNVIATYIQQNWGGKFYDCGINVTEVNYEECAQLLRDAIAYAQQDVLLTNRMKADIQALIADAENELATNRDAAELRNYARELKAAVDVIFGYSSTVKTLKDTWEICRKMEDKGWWGTSLEAATAALDTCATASDLNKYLDPLRNARKATAMERHTENYVGCVPEAVTTDEIGDWDGSCPKYYLFNVGAKNFLGAGEDWGTHLAIEYISNPMMLIQATREVIDPDTGDNAFDEDGNPIIEPIEGAYYIETFRPNGDIGSMDFMGWNGYIDCPMNSLWELIPVINTNTSVEPIGDLNDPVDIPTHGTGRVIYNIAQYNQFSETGGVTYNGKEYEPGTRSYLGLRNGDNRFAPSYYVVDTDMRSPELATNQWIFVTREELLSFIKTASEENPVDLSFLINNPGYDQRLSIDDWMFTNGSVFGRNGNHHNFVFEAYNAEDFWMAQDLWPDEGEEALPAGTYVLEVQGYYRDGIEGEHLRKVLAQEPVEQRAIIFAGASSDLTDPDNRWETMPLAPIHIEANQVPGIGYGADEGLRVPGTYGGQPVNATDQAGMEFFPCGLYMNQLVFTIPEDDMGHISIGINKDYDPNRPNGDWCVMDNWRIKYYGAGEIDPDAIKGVESDEISKTTVASKGIYNMLGQRLSKAQKGVNIIGGKKIVKK